MATCQKLGVAGASAPTKVFLAALTAMRAIFTRPTGRPATDVMGWSSYAQTSPLVPRQGHRVEDILLLVAAAVTAEEHDPRALGLGHHHPFPMTTRNLSSPASAVGLCRTPVVAAVLWRHRPVGPVADKEVSCELGQPPVRDH